MIRTSQIYATPLRPKLARLTSLLCVFALMTSSVTLGMAQAATEETEIIRFGVRHDAAPLSFMKDGKWVGYSVNLCSLILDAYRKELPDGASVEAEFVRVTASNRFEFLKRGDVDALCEATTVTISRMKSHHFSLLTFVSGAGGIKKKETSVRALKGKSTRARGIKVSVVDGTTTKEQVEKLLGYAVVFPSKPVPSHDVAFDLLRNGDVELYVGDRIILREKLLNQNDRDDYDLSAGFLSYEPYAIAIRHGREDLLQVANATLARLYRDGDEGIKPIYKLWFKDSKMSKLLWSMYQLQKLPE
ncbi:transporter substrate-binding domain-containing protein [Pelagibius sp. Alg239-R121]|uniref:transporter substrate-binding domain-containing protein n=1 Tax=Pelagibius sp. Alg239-R121 TaxID=2993448 RepID=UPI0024A7A1DB|nr:transporter substrate-binding domain-containing protein [Pelagibius sp. Alg239-R121]